MHFFSLLLASVFLQELSSHVAALSSDFAAPFQLFLFAYGLFRSKRIITIGLTVEDVLFRAESLRDAAELPFVGSR